MKNKQQQQMANVCNMCNLQRITGILTNELERIKKQQNIVENTQTDILQKRKHDEIKYTWKDVWPHSNKRNTNTMLNPLIWFYHQI